MKSWGEPFKEYVNLKREAVFVGADKIYDLPPKDCTLIERGNWRLERDRAISAYLAREIEREKEEFFRRCQNKRAAIGDAWGGVVMRDDYSPKDDADCVKESVRQKPWWRLFGT
jgi:hypothetical protein